MIQAEHSTRKELEKLLENLTGVATMIPGTLHLLYNIRFQFEILKTNKKKLSFHRQNDLRLCKELTTRATKGLDLNHLVKRAPNFTLYADACNMGIEGVWCDGTAFAFDIARTPLENLHINILEAIALIVGIMELSTRATLKLTRLHGFGDSMSALAWLKSAATGSFISKIVARELEKLIARLDISLQSKHIAGISNWLADQLSRNAHLTCSESTYYFI